MKARRTSWSEAAVRPAALALRTKVIADRAGSGDRDAKQSFGVHAFVPPDPKSLSLPPGNPKIQFHARFRDQSKPNLCVPASCKPPSQRRFLSHEQRLGAGRLGTALNPMVREGRGNERLQDASRRGLIAARRRTTLTSKGRGIFCGCGPSVRSADARQVEAV
jgi:hypothetical protein